MTADWIVDLYDVIAVIVLTPIKLRQLEDVPIVPHRQVAKTHSEILGNNRAILLCSVPQMAKVAKSPKRVSRGSLY